MQTYKLHFIRHGITEGNAKGQYIGVTDLSLTTDSIDELKLLQKKGIYPKCELVFGSEQKRALETAQIIFPNAEILPVKDLNEIDFGTFEGKTPMDLKDNSDYTRWVKGEIPAAPQGETTVDFAARLCVGLRHCVQTMMDEGVYTAGVVLSGGAIMALLAVAALPRRQMKEWACNPGNGYTVQITPSLYMKSGIIEVIGEIPQGGAHITALKEPKN